MKKIFQILFLITVSWGMYAQESRVKKADKQYESYQYIDAIETYKKVVEKGYKSPEILQKIADSYYFNANYSEAVQWYAQLLKMQPNPKNSEYYFRYAQCLKSVKKYAQADEYMDKYYKANPQLAHKEKNNYLDEIEKNSGRYTIENLKNINSEYSDYGGFVYNGQLVFTSTRKSNVLLNRKMGWNNQPFSRLYSAEINDKKVAGKVKEFSDELTSRFNESTAVFFKDGKTVYFTRNNYLKKRGFSDDKSTLLKIYRATIQDGKWTNIEELSINNDNYNTAHPALSPDERTLYFASDRPGGLGDSDIWKVAIHEDGSLGNPVNLGPNVNTHAKETFPFVSGDNQLYFSSSGKLGLGGLDIFVSKITDDLYSKAINVGKPINSQQDDFAFYIDSDSRTGFFSTNRKGGKGDDDIYRFQEIRKLECLAELAGQVLDMNTHEAIADALVEVFDKDDKLIATMHTDASGMYSIGKLLLDGETHCRIRAGKSEYASDEKQVVLICGSREHVVLSLEKQKVVPKVGDDLKDLLSIPIIYFDLDKWNIRQDAVVELSKILYVLQEYPNMKIDIRSHTDSRQSHTYNLKLSENRANATRDWLISQGIAEDRLTAKGFGETQLLNRCADGVDCSEQEHQQNRRSEFIIISME